MSNVIFDEALTGTQYAPSAVTQPGGLKVKRGEIIGWTIEHPAATDTTYTVQVSNMSDIEVAAGENDWSDYDEIEDLVLDAEVNDWIEMVDCAFERVRLKARTTSGSGVATIRACKK